MSLKFRKLKEGKAKERYMKCAQNRKDFEFRPETLGTYFRDVLLTIYKKKEFHSLKPLKQIPTLNFLVYLSVYLSFFCLIF